MAACEACKILNGKLKDAEPHPTLERNGSADLGRISHGKAKGSVIHYRCKACGSKLSRDCDLKDPGAGWFISKEG